MQVGCPQAHKYVIFFGGFAHMMPRYITSTSTWILWSTLSSYKSKMFFIFRPDKRKSTKRVSINLARIKPWKNGTTDNLTLWRDDKARMDEKWNHDSATCLGATLVINGKYTVYENRLRAHNGKTTISQLYHTKSQRMLLSPSQIIGRFGFSR